MHPHTLARVLVAAALLLALYDVPSGPLWRDGAQLQPSEAPALCLIPWGAATWAEPLSAKAMQIATLGQSWRDPIAEYSGDHALVPTEEAFIRLVRDRSGGVVSRARCCTCGFERAGEHLQRASKLRRSRWRAVTPVTCGWRNVVRAAAAPAHCLRGGRPSAAIRNGMPALASQSFRSCN